MNSTILYNHYCQPVGVIKNEFNSKKLTIDLGFIKYCDYTTKQVADFLEETGFMTEEQAYIKEKDLWFDFYLNFNDNNMTHAENAFLSNGLDFDASAEIIHHENLNWVKEIISMGVSTETICSKIQEAKRIVDELRGLESREEIDYEQ